MYFFDVVGVFLKYLVSIWWYEICNGVLFWVKVGVMSSVVIVEVVVKWDKVFILVCVKCDVCICKGGWWRCYVGLGWLGGLFLNFYVWVG